MYWNFHIKIILFVLGFIFFPIQNGKAKVFERKDKVIHVESKPLDYNQNWLQGESDSKTAVKRLIKILATSFKGREILKEATKKAKKEGRALENIFSVGNKSYTDITLMRRFSKDQSKTVQYKSFFRIFINRHLSIRNGVLDMAHELIHYTLRDTFNPYINKFDLKHFISTTIEGKGGEVDAYLTECEVSLEIFFKKGNSRRCSLVIDQNTGKLSRGLGIRRFYQIGHHYKLFKQKIKKHRFTIDDLPNVSDKQVLFVSAAYDLPYPMAALNEYEHILNKICKNDSRRLKVMEQSREPSQNHLTTTNTLSQYQQLLKRYKKRCSSVL